MDLPPLRPTSISPTHSVGAKAEDRQAGGRVFSAEVVQTAAGGSLVLAVGAERIAATSLAALQVGQKLLLRVRGSGASQTLEVLSTLPDPDPASAGSLVRTESRPHLFGLLAQGKGVGELLADLSAALTQAGSETPRPEFQQALESHAFPPGESGAGLAQHLARSPLGHEARLLGKTLDQLPAAGLGAAAEAVLASALEDLEPAARAQVREALGRGLAQLLGDPQALLRLVASAPNSGGSAGGAVAVLRAWLAPALARTLGALSLPAHTRAQAAEMLLFARHSPRLSQALVELLLGEHAALAGVLTPPSAENLPAASADPAELKTWLAKLATTGEPGPEHGAARAALDSLEAEQFVALARSHLGEGTHLAFALREGAAFADARLVYRRAQEREPAEGGGQGACAERAVLGLEFSRTGPLRAEFLLDSSALRVRLSVAAEDVAAQLNAGLDELREPLQALGRGVQVQVVVCPRESLRVPGPDEDAALGDGGSAVDVVG